MKRNEGLRLSCGDRRLAERLSMAEIIAHVAAGVDTEAEKQRLEEWLRESLAHRQELDRIRYRIEHEAGEPLDMEEMWKGFRRRVSRRKAGLKIVWRYAAILALPLIIAGGWYFGMQTEKKVPVAVVEQITPGKYQARLILSGGETVNITRENGVDLREQDGAHISSVGRTLCYRKAADTVDRTVCAYNTLQVPVGGEFALQLSDGTRVWLNAGSELRYPVVFQGKCREVEIKGEGYFEVEKNERQPFIVHANDVGIRVLGTAFNISTYEQRIAATLVSGKISLAKGENRVELHPGEQAVTRSAEENFHIGKVNARNFALWKEGIFWFEDTDLGSLLNSLARWYDVELLYEDPELKKLKFSMEMKRYENIGTVLQKLAYTQKVKFRIEGRKVIVSP